MTKPDQDQDHLVPWLSLGFWNTGQLWANVDNKYWYMLEQVPVSELLFWTHICAGLDLDRAVITTSVNGRPGRLVEDVRQCSPLSLVESQRCFALICWIFIYVHCVAQPSLMP